MKLEPILRSIWNWLCPQTWPHILGVIILLLLAFLTAAFLRAGLKGGLP